MPVEIRELQITTVVQDSGTNTSSSGRNASPAVSTDEIVAKCVEQVMEILKEKSER